MATALNSVVHPSCTSTVHSVRTACDEWVRSAVRTPYSFAHKDSVHARLTFAFLGSRTTVLPLLLVVARRATATFTTARARKPLKAFISLYISVYRLLFLVAGTVAGMVGVPSEATGRPVCGGTQGTGHWATAAEQSATLLAI